MPIVTIQVTGTPLTQEQKSTLISRTTDVIVEVLNKKPESTRVLIEELPPENWGIGGESMSQLLKNE